MQKKELRRCKRKEQNIQKEKIRISRYEREESEGGREHRRVGEHKQICSDENGPVDGILK